VYEKSTRESELKAWATAYDFNIEGIKALLSKGRATSSDQRLRHIKPLIKTQGSLTPATLAGSWA